MPPSLPPAATPSRARRTPRRARSLAALFAALLSAGSALAESTLRIEQAWLREMPPVAKVNSAYFELYNDGDHPDRLLGARSALAAVVELHRSTQQDGQYRMQPVTAVEIPAGGRVSFRSGGYHLMFKQTRQAPRAGEQVAITLRFERAGEVRVHALVRGAGPSHAAKLAQPQPPHPAHPH